MCSNITQYLNIGLFKVMVRFWLLILDNKPTLKIDGISWNLKFIKAKTQGDETVKEK